MKILIVGLDAADYYWVKEFWDSMPNLRRLAEDGSFGRLESTAFPTTPQAWCSMYTGCTPEEHGISGFRKDGIAPIRVRPFWESLPWTIGLMNLPMVCARKNEKLRGFIVPGFSCPRRWHPSGLHPSGYVIETTNHQPGRARWLLGGNDRLKKGIKDAQIRFLRFNRETERRHVDFTLRLLKQYPVDMLFIGIMLIDRIGHSFAHHRDTMLDTYRTADSLLGRLIKEASPQLTVVFSDHGMDTVDSGRIPETVQANERDKLRKNPKKLQVRGTHTLDGIVCLSGAAIRTSKIEDAELRDIAPTLMYMINGDVPDVMSGKQLDVYSSGYTDVEQKALEESLAALGYI